MNIGVDYLLMGIRIKSRRIALRMKQYELAKQLEISNNHLSSIEKGKEKPSIDLLLKICNILKVTPDYLLLGLTHPNDIPQNIMDCLRLCSPSDIELAKHFIELLVERNKNNPNDKYSV